jgi:hypothetical protein
MMVIVVVDQIILDTSSNYQFDEDFILESGFRH